MNYVTINYAQNNAYYKIVSCIQSSKTLLHLDSCFRIIDNHYKIYKDIGEYRFLHRMICEKSLDIRHKNK